MMSSFKQSTCTFLFVMLLLGMQQKASLCFSVTGWSGLSKSYGKIPVTFISKPTRRTSSSIDTALLMSSFAADGSEYSSNDSGDFDDDDDITKGDSFRKGDDNYNEEDDVPTVELKPVPMSKNAGNRIVAFVWDRILGTQNGDELDRHYARIEHTEDHVMYCRKANLYNETFNTDSMVDVLWSRQILSCDLKRAVGHAICLESTDLKYVKEFLSNEPILKMLTDGDLSNIDMYRWRHIRDYSLRQDDGRFGFPVMLLAMDHQPEDQVTEQIRKETEIENLDFLMRSEKIIAGGPLHYLTEFKDDPSSIPVGDLIFYNAKNREDAIDFAESLPFAEEGLYSTMQVNFFNNLDVTGKFVSEDPLRDSPCEEMREALEIWGYPVADEQTPWLNW